MFKLSLWACSQRERVVSSEVVACSSSAKVQPGTVMLVAWAKIFSQDISRQLGRSFIYTEKKKKQRSQYTSLGNPAG